MVGRREGAPQEDAGEHLNRWLAAVDSGQDSGGSEACPTEELVSDAVMTGAFEGTARAGAVAVTAGLPAWRCWTDMRFPNATDSALVMLAQMLTARAHA